MEHWRVRITIRGADGFDVRGFLPRLFDEELAHLDATFTADDGGVIVTAVAVAPTADEAGAYVEGRVTASLRKRELPWIASVLDVAQSQT